MCDDSLDYDLKTFVSQTMHYNVTYLAVFLRIKYDQAGYPWKGHPNIPQKSFWSSKIGHLHIPSLKVHATTILLF